MSSDEKNKSKIKEVSFFLLTDKYSFSFMVPLSSGNGHNQVRKRNRKGTLGLSISG